MPTSTTSSPPVEPLTDRAGASLSWDIFCRVIDNHGDLGVCWRLARHLRALGDSVRLHVDRLDDLTWMAAPGELDAESAARLNTTAGPVDVSAGPAIQALPFDAPNADSPGNVVIEAFGCDLPEAWIARMATMARPPVWINLEYLSAESYVERAHGLASPQSVGPGAGLTKWFYYPGFTQGTGGLLLNTQALVQSTPSTTQDTSLALAPGDRLVSMFVYEHAQLSGLLDALDHEPTTVVAFQGAPLRALRAHFDGDRRGRHLRLRPLPWLSQADFDAVLRRCDLNVVRGEDSLVSAIAAGKPFVWNIYAQLDGVHAQKLWALLDRIRLACPTHPDQASEPAAWTAMKDLWLDLNRLSETRAHAPLTNARLDGWRRWQTPWLTGLQARPDLALGLRRFVQQRLGKPSPS